MKITAFRLIALVIAVVFLFQVACAVPIKSPDGTIVQVKLLQTLTSGKAQEGSIVRYVVIRDVIVGGEVVIASGARATGKVTTSKGRGWFGKNGKLEFSIESVEAVDKSLVPLRASMEGGSGKSNATAVILGTLFLSVLMIFVNGRDITVKEGTEFPAYIDGNSIVEATGLQSPANLTTAVYTTDTVPNAMFTVLGRTPTEKAVIGEIRNEGPECATADVIILIKKDGKQVGAGHAVVPNVKAGQSSAFNAEVAGSIDGEITVLVTVKASAINLQQNINTTNISKKDKVEDIIILSKVISDKEITGKLLNTRKDKVDILLTAICKEGDKTVGTGSITLKAVAPDESKEYLININGKTSSDVTVEAKPI